MKKIYLSVCALAIVFFSACGEKKAEESKYKYETVDGDLLGVKIYTLSNGLKVYISVNKDEPRVFTNIAVRTGSKNDPADCTGLAHYLEHMVFKGTSKFATIDWENEKVLLKQISDLYEKHRNTSDAEEKKKIYGQIDSISGLAAKFAVANEYDKMMSSLGAQATNAYTSTDQTVYVNDVPSNELEKWAMLESERFSELVLRLFHTELEAVYEEFNRGQDNDFRKAYYKASELLFPTHPYGTQTTIGTSDHLKNPSMERIHEYFNTYYVPNNMAIVLSGDIDPDKTVAMLDKYFGKLKAKDIPKKEVPQEQPLTQIQTAEVVGPSAEWINIAYRFDGSNSDDEVYMNLIGNLIYNGQAGLMDLNLIQKQKILRGNAFYNQMKDYGFYYMNAYPKSGQSLEEVKDLVLAEIEKIKKGEFEDWMLQAVVKNLKLEMEKYTESNYMRVSIMTDAFVLENDWKEVVETFNKMGTITKQQIMDFANKKFGDNYVLIYKKSGEDKNAAKVEKPKITPVDINREAQSTFAIKFDSIQSERVAPVFLDFKTAIQTASIGDKVNLQYVKNTTNKTFSLYYVIDRGTVDNRAMEMAVKYLPYLGTSKYSAEDLKKEFYKLGLSFDVYASNDRMYVNLSGLDDSFNEGVKLFEHLLSDCQPNEDALKELIADVLKSRIDNKKNKGAILNGGLMNYAKYGPQNPYTSILSEKDLLNLKSEDLVNQIKSITSFEHLVNYYGSKELAEVNTTLNSEHKLPATLTPLPERKVFAELPMDKPQVYFVDYDMVQNEMIMLSKSGAFNKDLMPVSNVFNQYFGGGLSSIVFQEIRESKALAYAAYSAFSIPNRPDFSNYVYAYIGTQSDKLGEATTAMVDLMNKMPEANKQFEDAKLASLKTIETERIIKESIFWQFDYYKRLGFDYDMRKEQYEAIQKLDMPTMKAFFDTNIKGKPYHYLVVGSKAKTDFNALKKLGEVKELKLNEVFGY